MHYSKFLLAASTVVSSVKALEPLTIKGSKFFTPDGNQFFMKGIAYQRSPADPLVDTDQCKTDAALMKVLGTNSIRVYHVDPEADHDGCMKAFDDASIYVFPDLDTFETYILQDGPHWNETQLNAYTKVLDAFAKYGNIGGFWVGNEIINTLAGSAAAPYIKAAVRDIKAYIAKKKYSRPIYLGYSAADIAELRPNLQNYLACGEDSSVNLDFFGLNSYSWCGSGTDYHVSGYDMLTKNATGYPIPIFFSETGCNEPKPRDFKDQFAIFGANMSSVWSGAIIYEWIQEDNKYGLIDYGSADPKTAIGGDTWARGGTPTPLPDFSVLSAVWAQITPTGIVEAKYTSTNGPISCPAFTANAWNADPKSALPTLGQTGRGAAVTNSGNGGSSTGGASPTGSTSNGSNGGSDTGSSTSTGAPSSTTSAKPNAAARNGGSVIVAGGLLVSVMTLISLL